MRSTIVSKLRTCSLLAIVAISTLTSAVHAMAQMPVLQVTIPFAFQSGSQRMPAGIYRIDLSSNHLLVLRAKDGKHFDNLLTIPDIRLSTVSTGKVVFHRYGSQYFLSEVWQANNPTGCHIPKSREEKEAQLALALPSPSNVELAMNTLRK